MLEYAVRAVLNRTAPRRFGVLDPLKVVIDELPGGAGRGRWTSSTTRRTPRPGTRKVPFARELWIERDDFMEEPAAEVLPARPGPRGAPRIAYFVTCREVVKDAAGELVELRCTL